MTRHWIPTIGRPVLSIVLLVAIIPVCYSDDEPASSSDDSAKPIKVAGIFESTRTTDITPGNEQLTTLKVQKVIPSGTKVAKGQALIWFETNELDKKLRDAKTDLELAKLALEADEFAHAQFLKKQALDKAKTKRTRDIAQQEFDNYQKVDRERSIKQAKFSLDSSKFSLESATEEFRQLEQMYKEDDLTEESEEIVLRRAKRSMESAAFSLERSQIQADRTLSQSVPRNDVNQEDTLARAIIDFDSASHSMDNDNRKRAIEIARKRLKFKEQSENFEKMRTERKKVVLKSEIDGIFLYGQISRGKPPAKPVDLKKGSSVSGKQIVGTVIDPSRLQVRVDLPEEHLSLVQKGTKCEVVAKGLSEIKLNGVVKSVGIIPIVPGKYDCIVTVRGKGLQNILPAMSCELLFDAPKADDSDKSGDDAKDGPSK